MLLIIVGCWWCIVKFVESEVLCSSCIWWSIIWLELNMLHWQSGIRWQYIHSINLALIRLSHRGHFWVHAWILVTDHKRCNFVKWLLMLIKCLLHWYLLIIGLLLLLLVQKVLNSRIRLNQIRISYLIVLLIVLYRASWFSQVTMKVWLSAWKKQWHHRLCGALLWIIVTWKLIVWLKWLLILK